MNSDELIDEILADRQVSETREDHSALFNYEVSLLVTPLTVRPLSTTLLTYSFSRTDKIIQVLLCSAQVL